MKKWLVLLVLFVANLFICGCAKNPVADFYMSSDTVFVGETVYFTNASVNYDVLYWDFGGELVGYEECPAVSFSLPGDYDVSLTAYYKDRSSVMTKVLHVLERQSGNSDENGGTSGGDITGGGTTGGGTTGGGTTGGDTDNPFTQFKFINAHNYPYNITQYRDGLEVGTYVIGANQTKVISAKVGTTERYTVLQKDGYFEYPNTINITPTAIMPGHNYSYTIRCRDAYIKYRNTNDDPYYVEVICDALHYDHIVTLNGFATDSVAVTSGYSYQLKFTQKSGYTFFPSATEYTINADCGYIYTRITPTNVKGEEQVEIEPYQY